MDSDGEEVFVDDLTLRPADGARDGSTRQSWRAASGRLGRSGAQFKQAFPENFRAYARAAKAGEIQPGRMFVFRTGLVTNPRFIINFPTKRHWRGRSRMEYIESGLTALTAEIRRLGIRSVAVPPLGCGNGGLEWTDVRPRIVAAMAQIPDVTVLLFEPRGAPAANEMPIGTKRPAMTSARAVLIKLMEQYSTLAYRLTLLEKRRRTQFFDRRWSRAAGWRASGGSSRASRLRMGWSCCRRSTGLRNTTRA